jgi:aconitase A
MSTNSFNSKSTLNVSGKTYEIFDISKIEGAGSLPFSLKILLENLLRTEDGANITAAHIKALAQWDPSTEPDTEIQFTPARVIMQDFTGVPCIVDLATMREAIVALGGDPAKVNPLAPAELVIDHSVIADVFGTKDAFEKNTDIEYERNRERYRFLRWGQGAFDEFKVVPPGTGIVHQVNIEYLARVVMTRNVKGVLRAYPDTVVGTDSHTTMVNGLGVLGWGVGGIEAEAALLGQPVSMLIPRVVGFKLKGELPLGTTATDLALTITEILRKHGVVGKFVEFYGPGVVSVPMANRTTIGNMSPEYGSTCAIFPIDEETLRYLKLTGRSAEQVELVEKYAKLQGLWHNPEISPRFSENIELDLSTVVPSIAGPKRPQDRISLSDSKSSFEKVLPDITADNVMRSFSKKGVFGMEKFESMLHTFFQELDFDIKGKTISDAKMPLHIVASNITKGVPTLFSGKVPLISAILASCCLPGVFKPQQIYGQLYIDGDMFTPCISSIVGPRKNTLVMVLGKYPVAYVDPKNVDTMSPLLYTNTIFSMIMNQFSIAQKTPGILFLRYPKLRSTSDLNDFVIEDILEHSAKQLRTFLAERRYEEGTESSG